ncbi:hypothetical protein BBP40_009625 [Aspergillus hancockii]|nr:hypothetical protein BBP40_009625 [Aspergillus hancockii]
MARHSMEPFILLFTVPAIFFVSVVYGAMAAAGAVPVTALSSYMTLPPYNFTASHIGLIGLPPFIGTSIAVLIEKRLGHLRAGNEAPDRGNFYLICPSEAFHVRYRVEQWVSLAAGGR